MNYPQPREEVFRTALDGRSVVADFASHPLGMPVSVRIATAVGQNSQAVVKQTEPEAVQHVLLGAPSGSLSGRSC